MALNLQLIQTTDQTHLWAKRYDVELRDAFTTLNAIAHEIAGRLGIIAVGETIRPARRPTEHLPAYNLYLQGRYLMYKATPEHMAKAKQCFEGAIALDPEFALAYDSLAETHWYLGFLGLAPPKEVCAAGMFYALRALEIDNTLAETHALLGMYREQLDYSWPEVNREMTRALELNPASPVVRLRYAVSGLMPHGRIEEAVRELEIAVELDPLSTFARFWLGVMLLMGHGWDEAIEQGRLILELDPAYFGAHFVTGVALREKRNFEEAIAAQRRAVELSGGSPLMLGWLGMVLGQSGNTAEARTILDQFHLIARQAYVPPTSFAWIYLGLGEIDSAFEWMDRAIDARDRMTVPIKSYAFLDSVQADPRYRALLAKMHLEA